MANQQLFNFRIYTSFILSFCCILQKFIISCYKTKFLKIVKPLRPVQPSPSAPLTIGLSCRKRQALFTRYLPRNQVRNGSALKTHRPASIRIRPIPCHIKVFTLHTYAPAFLYIPHPATVPALTLRFLKSGGLVPMHNIIPPPAKKSCPRQPASPGGIKGSVWQPSGHL